MSMLQQFDRWSQPCEPHQHWWLFLIILKTRVHVPVNRSHLQPTFMPPIGSAVSQNGAEGDKSEYALTVPDSMTVTVLSTPSAARKAAAARLRAFPVSTE
jgi:hypothetical protein